jgi:L-alanine-DL-glutamate epimerase-like enolase superfamily enzyme
MSIQSVEVFFLRIPLRLSISHGAHTDRSFSDSLIVKISASRGAVGYGEGVIRDYVSGSLGGGALLQENVAQSLRRLIAPLKEWSGSWKDADACLRGAQCADNELPLLCALETALLDLSCRTAGTDVFALLDAEPLRSTVRYGGALPLLPLDQAARYLGMYASFGFPDVKIKVTSDLTYNDRLLSMCRQALGAGSDIRVDANAAWKVDDADAHLDVCARHGVTLIEQPFAVLAQGLAPVVARAHARGFRFMADEGFLTAADVASIAASGTSHMLNLRLSKNGGLSRVLSLARTATANGLAYQLGCMVGETGILSSLGRVAAALLPDAVYLEGSYDDVLLSENVTTRSFGFGPGGNAPVIRGQGLGFEVDGEKLVRLSVDRLRLDI